MKPNISNKQVYIIAVFFLVAVLVFYYLYSKDDTKLVPEVKPEITNEVVNEELKEVEQSNTNEETKPSVSTEVKALTQQAHELYLNEKYKEAVVILNKVLSLQKNEEIYRSLYTNYLALKDYPKAEDAIKKAINAKTSIPNNWNEYATFERYNMKASFGVVSAIYLDALKATNNHIDLLTAYSAYLSDEKKYSEAIVYLEKAITVYPANKVIYQAEIDRLKSL